MLPGPNFGYPSCSHANIFKGANMQILLPTAIVQSTMINVAIIGDCVHPIFTCL